MNAFILPEISHVWPIIVGSAVFVAAVLLGFVFTNSLRNLAGAISAIGAGFAATLLTFAILLIVSAGETTEKLDSWLVSNYGIEASDKVLDSLNPYGSKNDQDLEVVVDYNGEPTTVKLTPYEDGYILVNDAKDPLEQR